MNATGLACGKHRRVATMLEVLDALTYAQRLISAPRPNAGNILAFHDHRVGGICTDPRLLLVPLDDHLCHRGDGVFESIAYRCRRMFQLDAHLERMKNSAMGLNLSPPCSLEELRAIILAVATAGGEDDGAMRILIGRGPGGFGISPTECPRASLYVAALRSRVPDEDWYNKGLTAFRSSIPAKQEYLARIKNANYLPNVLMAEEARKRGMDVALSFDDEGCLAEAAIANIAIVDKDGVLCCPEFTNSLPGTTVLTAMRVATETMPTAFRKITEAEIFTAREMLLFSSTPLCVGITHYEGRSIGTGVTGPVAHSLRGQLLERLLAEGAPF